MPTPMAMLAHDVDVVKMTDKTELFLSMNNDVNMIEDQDVHIMDKEFLNG